MNEILLLCLMVLVVIGNTSGRWTKKSEEFSKDLKEEKENMKEFFAHRQENISNIRYTTTTSTSTMPPTTSTSTMPTTTTTNNNKEVMEAIEELKDEIRNERKVEMEKNKQDRIKTLIYLCRVHGFFSRRHDVCGLGNLLKNYPLIGSESCLTLQCSMGEK